MNVFEQAIEYEKAGYFNAACAGFRDEILRLKTALRRIAERKNAGLNTDMPVLDRAECTQLARAVLADHTLG